jgi:hypothetical protein
MSSLRSMSRTANWLREITTIATKMPRLHFALICLDLARLVASPRFPKTQQEGNRGDRTAERRLVSRVQLAVKAAIEREGLTIGIREHELLRPGRQIWRCQTQSVCIPEHESGALAAERSGGARQKPAAANDDCCASRCRAACRRQSTDRKGQVRAKRWEAKPAGGVEDVDAAAEARRCSRIGGFGRGATVRKG